MKYIHFFLKIKEKYVKLNFSNPYMVFDCYLEKDFSMSFFISLFEAGNNSYRNYIALLAKLQSSH